VYPSLRSFQVLPQFDPELPIKLAGDTSSYGIGTVIFHVLPKLMEKNIPLLSHQKLEKSYGLIDKEALSLLFGKSRSVTSICMATSLIGDRL